jgi:hypothetical protein
MRQQKKGKRFESGGKSMKKGLFASGFVFFLAGLVYGAAEIGVSPLEYDFGLVEVGLSGSVVLTIDNLGDTALAVNDVYFKSGSSGDFAVTSFLFLPVFIGPGGQFVIEVTFAPAVEGPSTASLMIISSDADEPQTEILLFGEAPSGQKTPQEMIADIISFADQSIQDGTLAGLGPGKSAGNRLRTWRKMLDPVQKMIEKGCYAEAADKLESIYKKTDGNTKPCDFVTGPAAGQMAQMILDLIETLEAMEEANLPCHPKKGPKGNKSCQ